MEDDVGCFDTIWAKCPNCDNREGFQSKGGDCILKDYLIEDAPPDVLSDVNRHSPHTCLKCGTQFYIDPASRASIEWKGAPLF